MAGPLGDPALRRRDPDFAAVLTEAAMAFLHREIAARGEARLSMSDFDAYQTAKISGQGIQLDYDEATSNVIFRHVRADAGPRS